VKGKYFTEIAAEEQGDHTALLREAARALAATIPGSTATPAQISWFPPDGLTAGPPRLVPESVLGVRTLKRGYVAQYGPAKAFIVTEMSSNSAGQVLKAWLGRYEATPAKVEAADESYAVTDKYLGRIVVARRGARIAGYASVPEGADAETLTSALLARIPR
jgi:hypothetical protein